MDFVRKKRTIFLTDQKIHQITAMSLYPEKFQINLEYIAYIYLPFLKRKILKI